MSIKMSCTAKRTIVSAILVGICIVVAGIYFMVATTRGDIPVAAGYELFHPDSVSFVLCDSRGSVLIDTQVEEIGIVDRFIVGRAVKPPPGAYPWVRFPVGYFVVDTQSRKVTGGLSEAELAQRIGRSVPDLEHPLIWALWHW